MFKIKNALIYRIEQWEPPTQAEIAQRLERARFAECTPSQPESAGWVEPRGRKHGPLLESVGGQLILELCTELKPVPGGVVKQQLEARLERLRAIARVNIAESRRARALGIPLDVYFSRGEP